MKPTFIQYIKSQFHKHSKIKNMEQPIYVAKQNADLSIDLYTESQAIGLDFNPVAILTPAFQDVTIVELQPLLDDANAQVADLQARIAAIQNVTTSTVETPQ